jgi:hypothetical protein
MKHFGEPKMHKKFLMISLIKSQIYLEMTMLISVNWAELQNKME